MRASLKAIICVMQSYSEVIIAQHTEISSLAGFERKPHDYSWVNQEVCQAHVRQLEKDKPQASYMWRTAVDCN